MIRVLDSWKRNKACAAGQIFGFKLQSSNRVREGVGVAGERVGGGQLRVGSSPGKA